ncbi:MAG TPA: hypothetical protein VH351_21530 [Bryobacteraceae bacterium]|nr:hypothetical protein [Bryobacteraceae bacterium]
MHIYRIRFWPYMADTHVDIAMYGHAFVAGDVLYASVYLATGEYVRHGGICPPPRDQSIRDVYRYPSAARRVHHFRLQLEIYFGAPPSPSFGPMILGNPNGRGSRSHSGRALSAAGEKSRWQAVKMICQAELAPWAIPDAMLTTEAVEGPGAPF